MPTRDHELESDWLSAWAPFGGCSPVDVRYLIIYPHPRVTIPVLMVKSGLHSFAPLNVSGKYH